MLSVNLESVESLVTTASVVIVVIIVTVCTARPHQLVSLRAALTLVGHRPQLVLVHVDVELGEVSLDAPHHLGLEGGGGWGGEVLVIIIQLR